ncbi:MAG TPA: DUF3536 domain-containing protein, partial [Gemmatimonadales bacterium]|nr:DUF3536 domain-containing protein [Gemmatimonadales bacterium]
EEPWLEEIEAEASAAPCHDWNQRIEQECYRAVVAARIPGADGRIDRIINTLEWISFNFGPTLLEWMERYAPDTYQAVLAADRRSAERLGHGNAIAMPYHHTILPLSTARDRSTEIRWGIADFRRRFGRAPQGMWLPETAVDEDTLDALATEGIRFTILAPHQLEGAPADGSPGLFRTSSGREITLCGYDGPISHDVAFGPLVRDAVAWQSRLLGDGKGTPRRLVAVATDGETYGHHHAFGEMALARLIESLQAEPQARLENFASYLARHPATTAVGLVSPSSWSCSHGVERWRSDCGCKVAPEQPTQQQWRKPLRDGIDWLAAQLHARYSSEAQKWFADPWAVRDGYGALIGEAPETALDWVRRQALRGSDAKGLIRAAEWLEVERGALRMHTSCAWFFDDLAGIEVRQVLRYAVRALALAEPEPGPLLAGFAERLAPAESNEFGAPNGSEMVRGLALNPLPHPARIAAGLGAARELMVQLPQALGYSLEDPGQGFRLRHRRTGWEQPFRIETTQTGVGVLVRLEADWLQEPLLLELEDLPELPREAIRQTLRGSLIRRWLSKEESDRLHDGRLLPREAALLAFTRAVDGLALDQGPDAKRRVTDLAALYQSFGRTVPFDVQTRFYRVWSGLTGDQAASLDSVARALGFTSRTGP